MCAWGHRTPPAFSGAAATHHQRRLHTAPETEFPVCNAVRLALCEAKRRSHVARSWRPAALGGMYLPLLLTGCGSERHFA